MVDSSVFFTFGQAAIYGLIALVGSIVGLRQLPVFRRSLYWWLLAIAFCNSLLQPFVYMWMTSYTVSLADAVLMRTFHAGSWLVAEGYSVFLGLAVGGLIGFGFGRRLDTTDPSDGSTQSIAERNGRRESRE